MINNENQYLYPENIKNWDDYFLQISKYPRPILINLFINNLELFLIIGEKLFTCINQKTLVAIHSILMVLIDYNFRYFEQINFYLDEEMPKHILGKATKILLFFSKCTSNELFNLKLTDVLNEFSNYDFSTKENLCKILSLTIEYKGFSFLHLINERSLILIFDFLDEIFKGERKSIGILYNYIVQNLHYINLSNSNYFKLFQAVQ